MQVGNNSQIDANVYLNANQSLNAIATGVTLNQASNDASSLAISNNLQVEANGYSQAIENTNSAIALTQIADGATKEQSNILDNVKEKLLQASTDTTYTHAYVTHSEPVYEYRNNQRYNDSYENNHYRSDYSNNYSNNNDIGLDTIVGGTIGVIIGNQIGRGNGKTAAKIVGGLVGATVANNTRYQNNAYAQNTGYTRNYNDNNRYNKHHKRRKQKVLVGYENYFIYKNREFHKFSNHRKDRIRITETINF